MQNLRRSGTLRSLQSGTVIKFDNRMTSQHGASTVLGEFSESIHLFRLFFGCVRVVYPEF